MATRAHSRPGQRDLTVGPIGPTLLAFALPTLASNILQSLNGSINSIWVGRFLGEGALAATSNANIIMFLMFSAVFGFGMAATILIGQSVGRGDIDGARRAFGSAVGLVVGGAVVIAVIGWLFAPQILRLLATPGEAQNMARDYLRVIFLGLPFSMLGVLIQMSLRGTGDSLTPLWFMALTRRDRQHVQPAADRRDRAVPEDGDRGVGDRDLARRDRLVGGAADLRLLRATCRSGCAGRNCAT